MDDVLSGVRPCTARETIKVSSVCMRSRDWINGLLGRKMCRVVIGQMVVSGSWGVGGNTAIALMKEFDAEIDR